MKKNSIKILLIVLLLLVSGLFMLRYNHGDVPIEEFTVVKSWWPVWETFQIGVEQYEAEKKQFHTNFMQTDNYGAALTLFKKEEVHAAILTIYEAILAKHEGIPIKIILLLDYTTGSDGLVAKNTISSLQALKGKRIGVETGTISHFTVLKALEKAGLEQSEVTMVHYKNSKAMGKAFSDGQIDAAGTFEPYMSAMAQKGGGYIIFSSREIPRSICDVLFIKDPLAQEKPELIDHWIAGWDHALKLKNNDTENYLKQLSHLSKISIPDLKKSFDGIFFTSLAENRMAFGTNGKEGYLLNALQEMERFMIEQDVIQNSLPLNEMIDANGIHRFFKQ